MHKFIACDDIRYSQGEEIVADRVIPLTYGENAVELDLTALTMVEALKLPLGTLLEMGRPVHTPKPQKPKVEKPKPKVEKPNENHNGNHRSKAHAYYAEMREFAREHNIPCPRNKDSTYNYSHDLRNRYDAWLATQVHESVP
jgi:hypothetical protein